MFRTREFVIFTMAGLLLISCAHESVDAVALEDQVKVDAGDEAKFIDPLFTPSESELAKAELDLGSDGPVVETSAPEVGKTESSVSTSEVVASEVPQLAAAELTDDSKVVADDRSPAGVIPPTTVEPEVSAYTGETIATSGTFETVTVAAIEPEQKRAEPKPRAVQKARVAVHSAPRIASDIVAPTPVVVDREVASAPAAKESIVVATTPYAGVAAQPVKPPVAKEVKIDKQLAGADVGSFVERNPLVAVCTLVVAFLTLAFVINRKRGSRFDF